MAILSDPPAVPADVAALAADLRALLDAGLVEPRPELDGDIRFAPVSERHDAPRRAATPSHGRDAHD